MKKSFVQGAFILMVAALINRVIGFVYQAVIFRLIGPEGMGLFNLVYPVYILIIVLATAGIPLGISKLVSEEQVRGNNRRSYEILWLSLSILAFSGAFFTLLTYLLSPLIGKYIFTNKMVYPVFVCLIPGIFIVSVSSAFRGFFQGLMNMKPPAIGQVIEQVIRVLFGVSAATYLLPMGIQWAAVGVASASVIGELGGLIVLLWIFFKQKPAGCSASLPGLPASMQILENLIKMCTPITLGRVAATFMLAVDSILIPYVLKEAGYSTSQATAFYGQFTTVALTLLFVPSVITVSLATSLVPAISEAVAENRSITISSRTGKAIRVTLLTGIPFVAAFLTLPEQITQAIYGSTEGGQLLAILALSGIFVYLQQTTTGVLQGLGCPVIPLKNMIFAACLKVIGILALSTMAVFDVRAIAVIYDVFFACSAILNIIALYGKTDFKFSLFNDFIKPAAAGLTTGLLFLKGHEFIYSVTHSNAFGVTVALLIGFSGYFILLVIIGVLKKNDLLKIPVIKKLIR